MCEHDGAVNVGDTTSDLDPTLGERSSAFVDCKYPSLEGFPGFEKKASVVVERFDISRYLRKKKPAVFKAIKSKIKWKIKPIKQPYYKLSKIKKRKHKLSRKPVLKELTKIQTASSVGSSKCSVSLFRDDLETLKELLKTNPEESENFKARIPSMSLRCNICEKLYSSEKKLHNHQENKHMIVYEPEKVKTPKRVSFSDTVTVHVLKEYHKCRKCPKIFDSYKALKGHMKEEHKKRKCYICHHCKKKFVDRMFFKVHVKLHCDSCGLLFSSKAKCTDHKRYVCKTLKFHKCKTCNLTFFKLIDLKDHSYDHIGYDCFVCDICKDQCKSKCAVAHHICFLHSKRLNRNNLTLYVTKKIVRENIFLCRFCEESSVDRDLIEKHVELLPDLSNRAMTGYKDYYFCDQCLKQFDTESDMLQHKWTHFLKMPDNSQTRPKSEVSENNGIKYFYNINEKIPDCFYPKLVVEKMKFDDKVLKEPLHYETSVDSFDINSASLKKPVVDPKSKRTIISKHQCENCGKYFSNNYCLNRHMETQHSDYENLRCKVCEEVFSWPSLLKSHKCIRIQIPEMPFEDARQEIHFDNWHEISTQSVSNGVIELDNGFDDLNIAESDNYMNTVDFEIPAPIVELTEQQNSFVPFVPVVPAIQNGQVNSNQSKVNALQTLGYKLVMQEVPIEF